MNTGSLYYIHVNLTIVLLLAFIVLVAGLTTAKTIPVTKFLLIGIVYHLTVRLTYPVVVWSDSWLTTLSVSLCVLLDVG